MWYITSLVRSIDQGGSIDANVTPAVLVENVGMTPKLAQIMGGFGKRYFAWRVLALLTSSVVNLMFLIGQ